MKETYTRPIVANSDVMGNSNGIFPVVVGGGLSAIAAGVGVARKLMKAAPVSKLQSLTRRKSD